MRRKIEVDDQASGVYLLIRAWSRVVIVLKVGIELNVLAHRKKATREEVRCIPFSVLALVEKLGAGVRLRMV